MKAPRGARAIGTLAAQCLDPTVRKRGLAQAGLVTYWRDVVGAELGEATIPERIAWPRRETGARGRLVLRCDPAAALTVDYQRDLIIERVNAFFGFPAIDRVQVRQRAVRPSAPPARRTVVSAEDDAALDRKLAHVDEDLRESLRGLGRAILARRRGA